MGSHVHNSITDSDKSRCVVYKELNPYSEVHDIRTTRHKINEFHRLSFTRSRVYGHSLVVETRRWNRRGRGRLPVDERLCVCNLFPTERHVVVYPVAQHIRGTQNYTRLEDLAENCVANDVKCRILHDI